MSEMYSSKRALSSSGGRRALGHLCRSFTLTICRGDSVITSIECLKLVSNQRSQRLQIIITNIFAMSTRGSDFTLVFNREILTFLTDSESTQLHKSVERCFKTRLFWQQTKKQSSRYFGRSPTHIISCLQLQGAQDFIDLSNGIQIQISQFFDR